MNGVIEFLAMAGILMSICCQIWLILLIMRGSPLLAIVALIVPFFTLYFAIHNWDIAKRPAIGLMLANLLFVAGACILPEIMK